MTGCSVSIMIQHPDYHAVTHGRGGNANRASYSGSGASSGDGGAIHANGECCMRFSFAAEATKGRKGRGGDITGEGKEPMPDLFCRVEGG